MTNRISSPTIRMFRDLASLSAVTAVSLGLAACGSEPPPPAAAPVAKRAPAPPPPPPAPTVTPIADLMARYDIDPRVNMSEDLAPDNDAGRIAVTALLSPRGQALCEPLCGVRGVCSVALAPALPGAWRWQAPPSPENG